MRKIFISYRRSDAEYAAGAFGRELRRHFGDDQVFRDKEDIPGGASWRQQVLHEIDHDSALLVLIGRGWTDLRDAQGNVRLRNPDDPLRLEIADGLRDRATILPVLLENATMPEERELPDELRPLAGLNALKLRDGDWEYDLATIFRALERAGFKASAAAQSGSLTPHPLVAQPAASSVGTKGWIGLGLAVFTFLVLLSDELDREGHLGAAMFSVGALVCGALSWREHIAGTRGRHVGTGVTLLAGFCLLAAIGGMDTAPSASAQQPAALLGRPGGDHVPDRPPIAPSGSLQVVPFLKGHGALQYDGATWKQQSDPAIASTDAQFHHASGEAFFKVISERIEVGVQKLADLGFQNVQKVDAKATITRRESRRVNGLAMEYREYEATVNEIPMTFAVHYYSDAAGSMQLVGWTARALAGEYRDVLDAMAAGFHVRSGE